MCQTVSFVLDERVEEGVEGTEAEGLEFEEEAEGGEGFSGDAVGADEGGERGLRWGGGEAREEGLEVGKEAGA